MARRYTYETIQVFERPPLVRKICKACSMASHRKARQCAHCGIVFQPKRPKKKPAPRPAKGTDARVRLDLEHAMRKTDEWVTKVQKAVTTLVAWNRAARRLSARLADGPKPVKPRPKRKVRGISLKGEP